MESLVAVSSLQPLISTGQITQNFHKTNVVNFLEARLDVLSASITEMYIQGVIIKNFQPRSLKYLSKICEGIHVKVK